MAQNNSLIVKSDYASRPSVPVGQKLNGIEINELGDFQKVQGVNQGAFDNTSVLIDGTGSYNNISYDQPTLTITILSSVATSGNNSKTVQMTFVQECTLSFAGAIGLTIGIPQGNVIIPGTYIFSFQHDPINSKVNFINFSGTAFQLLDGIGTEVREGNKIDLVSDTILSNLEWIITSGNDNLGFLLKSGETGHYYQNFVTKIRNEIIARADIAYMRAIDNANSIGAAIETNAAGEILISNSVNGYTFNAFKYKADYAGITWADELEIPHQKRVLELISGNANDFTLTNGSGTTANGTAVDLGGTLSSIVEIGGNGQSMSLGLVADLLNEFNVFASGNTSIDTTGTLVIAGDSATALIRINAALLDIDGGDKPVKIRTQSSYGTVGQALIIDSSGNTKWTTLDLATGAELADHIAEPAGHTDIVFNNTHRLGDGSDHAAVAENSSKNSYPPADEAKMITIEEGAQVHIPPVHLADYADKTARNADQANQIIGHPYKTLDDESWWYLRSKTGSDGDYDGGGVVVEKMTLPCGALDVAAVVGRVYPIVADENYTIQSLYPFVDVAPSGGPLTMDIRINGTSILSTLINILDGQTLSDGNHVISTSTWSIGQKLEVFVTVNNGAEFPQITMTTTL